ncbi:MAG: oxidoreductase, 2OG-Fe(II) oxygenase family [Myxococcales bacterium]|nr:oxidoreductase, 2OG-Fe(II) oxygenase family [Myxococcales bacterium]
MMIPPGLKYLEEYVGVDEEARLISAVDEQPWLNDLKRRVQHYGYRYDYKARAVRRDMYLGTLPAWVTGFVDRIVQSRLMERPDQLIVNEYLPGQGITGHIDCVPCFGPVVISLSLGSTCLIELSRGDEKQPILLRPRSLLVLAGESRSLWRHRIPSRRSDKWDGGSYPRSRRVSLTFRTVRLSFD